MKKYYSVILIFLLIAIAATAQETSPCPTENLSQYPGKWKPRNGYVAGGQYKAKPGTYNKSAASVNLDKLLALAKQAYPTPMGGDADFTRYLDFSSAYSFMPIGYRLYIGHPGFTCSNTNKIALTYETGVYLNIAINNFENFASHLTAQQVAGTNKYIGAIKNSEPDYGINGKRVFLIPGNFISSNGWMDHYSKLDSGKEPTEQWFLIHRENEPLFNFVTRREYLTQFREELREYRDVYTRHIESEYKKYPESYKSVYNDLGNYKIKTDNAIKRVDEYLKNKSEEELNKPVSDQLSFEMFIHGDDKEIKFREDRFYMAYFNDAYQDKKLPLHIPQFMIAEFSANANDKTGRHAWKYNFRQKIMESLDFKAMYNMLAKIPGRAIQSKQPNAKKETAEKTTSAAVQSEKNSTSPRLNKVEKLVKQKDVQNTEESIKPVYDLDGNKYDIRKSINSFIQLPGESKAGYRQQRQYLHTGPGK